MRIGIDYWQTITRDPDFFRELIDSLVKDDWEVHIISAVGHKRAPITRDEIEATINTFTDIHIVIFDHPDQSPELKLAKCQELGIQLMIDDRRDICELLNLNGILACQLMRKNNIDYKSA